MHRARQLAVVTTLLWLSIGNAYPGQPIRSMPKDLTAWGGRIKRSVVLPALKDAPSARFKDIYVSAWTDDHDGKIKPVLCGEVNAKNSFGGYSGFQPFVADEHNALFGPQAADMFGDACGWHLKAIR
jgi:hypothetical protein